MATILVVDDSILAREAIVRALKVENHEVIEAVDGIDGYEKIIARPDIAFVITDLSMPRQDGIKMMEAARANPKSSTLRAFLVTAEFTDAIMSEAKKVGFVGFVRKPINEAKLLIAIGKALEL